MDNFEENKGCNENNTKENKGSTRNDNLGNKIGEHVDVKIGKEYGTKPVGDSDHNILEEILIQMEKQTEDLHQIKNIVTYLFSMFIISGAVAVVAIVMSMSS